MNSLSPNNPLFIRLQENPPAWWIALKNDKDLSVQVRKENYIDVYFNGGSIIRRLSYKRGSFSGEIHYKYIPVKGEDGDYVKFNFNSGISFGQVNALPLDNFSPNALREIKENIKYHYPPESEKGIQYSFIKNDPFYLDSEFQYYDSTQRKSIRIDLVRVDPSRSQIVFVEVKTMGDKRLYTDEIVEQLSCYSQFISNYGNPLLSYYKNVFNIKKALGILPGGLTGLNINNYTLFGKTLLLFGDCQQEWINSFAPILDPKIHDYAIGCYYFGAPKYNCNIIAHTSANRHIFLPG